MENLIELKCFRDSLNENELRLLHSLEHGQWIPISKLGGLLSQHGVYKKKPDTKLSDVFKEELSQFYDFENRIENGIWQPYIRMKQPKRIDASFYGQGSNSRVSTFTGILYADLFFPETKLQLFLDLLDNNVKAILTSILSDDMSCHLLRKYTYLNAYLNHSWHSSLRKGSLNFIKADCAGDVCALWHIGFNSIGTPIVAIIAVNCEKFHNSFIVNDVMLWDSANPLKPALSRLFPNFKPLSLHTTVESFVPSAPVVYKPDISRINFLPDDFLSTVTEHFALDSDAANVLKAVKMKAKSDADFRQTIEKRVCDVMSEFDKCKTNSNSCVVPFYNSKFGSFQFLIPLAFGRTYDAALIVSKEIDKNGSMCYKGSTIISRAAACAFVLGSATPICKGGEWLYTDIQLNTEFISKVSDINSTDSKDKIDSESAAELFKTESDDDNDKSNNTSVFDTVVDVVLGTVQIGSMLFDFLETI